jgi:hypothetical protein
MRRSLVHHPSGELNAEISTSYCRSLSSFVLRVGRELDSDSF